MASSSTIEQFTVRQKINFFAAEFFSNALVWATLWPLLFAVAPSEISKFVAANANNLYSIAFAISAVYLIVTLIPALKFILNGLTSLMIRDGKLHSNGTTNTAIGPSSEQSFGVIYKCFLFMAKFFLIAFLALKTLESISHDQQLLNEISALKSRVEKLEANANPKSL